MTEMVAAARQAAGDKLENFIAGAHSVSSS